MGFINILKQNLSDLNDVFLENDIGEEFFLIGGAVLSVERFDHKLNPKDEDIDFGVKRENIDLLEGIVIPDMSRRGYQISYSWYNSDGEVAQVSIKKPENDKYGIDFTIYDRTTDGWDYTCYIGIGDDREILKRNKHKTLDNLTKDVLEKWRFYMPAQRLTYLKELYGKGATTLRKNYQYWNPEHSPAIVEIREWKGYAKNDGEY